MDETQQTVAVYKPAPGKRVPLPGAQPDWPETGRPINPLSAYERRLVADGDLVLVSSAEVSETGGKK